MRRSSHLFAIVVVAVLVSPEPGRAQTAASPRTPQQIFDRGMNLITGTGVNRNDLDAVNYFRRAAEAGYAPAQTVMGYLYETGTVVASDARTAADWYGKAAAQNDRLAQWVLGRMYFTGQGPMRDRNEAMKWLRRSADAGDPFAALLLGEAEEELDPTPAVPWYRKAAQQGLPEAQTRLGRLLASGRVGAPQKYEAYVWLTVSFENGQSAVDDDLRRLEADLGSTRVEEAKAEARSLRDRTLRAAVARGCTGWDGELSALPSTPPPKVQAMCR